MNILNDYLNAHYLHAEYLWLLVVVVFFAGVLWWRKRDSVFVICLRMLAFALLITALADPVRQDTSESQELTALFDVSASISPRARAAMLDSLQPYLEKPDTTIQLVPFARNASSQLLKINKTSSNEETASSIAAIANKLDTGQTDIGGALNSMLAATDSSSIFLLSDGHETTGDARQVAQTAANYGASVFPLLPNERLFLNETLTISSLHAPLTIDAGERAEVRVSVANSFSSPQSGMLEIWLKEKKLLAQRITVDGKRERLITLKTPPTEGGLQRIRAVLQLDEKKPDEKEETYRWISVKEKSKILLISGTNEDNRVLKRLLTLKGYAIQDIVADGNTPIPIEFKGYSTVILNNAARRQLPSQFLPNLKNFTQRGGGVALVGGDRSFGLGEYINTPLEDLSPLKFVPPRTTKRRLTTAVVLVIDKSRSMVFERKIDAAKAAAVTAINALKDDDYVSVIGFDSAPFVIIRMTKVSEAKSTAPRRLQNLTPAGKTNLLPALANARQALRAVNASRKHIIVLSDGQFPLAGTQYLDEIQRMRKEDMTLSAVALGGEADVPFMKLMSEYGKGAFYHTLDPSQLPEIFLRDIKVTVGEETMKEQQDFGIYAGPSGLHSTTLSNFPFLRGFVETIPKEGARLELVTRKEDRNHPILASWRYGKGAVVAFTSDANGRWSLPWLKWSEFHRFWSQVLDSVKPKEGEKATEVDFDLRYVVNRGNLELDLSIFDEALRTGTTPRITANVVEPGGERKNISFEQAKKGRFSSVIENGRPGDYQVNITYGAVTFPPLALTLSGELFGEQQGRGVNIQNLSDIAYQTGGAINPDPQAVIGAKRVTEKSEHLFVPLVLLAFLLVLFEAFWRELGPRVILDHLIPPRFRSANAPTGRTKGQYDLRRGGQSRAA